MGCTRPKHRTGAATLEMNMLRKVATIMLASNTQWGFLPSLLWIAVAMDYAMKCLLRAPAMAKPPSRSMVTCMKKKKNEGFSQPTKACMKKQMAEFGQPTGA